MSRIRQSKIQNQLRSFAGRAIIGLPNLYFLFRYRTYLPARLLDVVDLSILIDALPFDNTDEEVRALRVGLLAQIGTLDLPSPEQGLKRTRARNEAGQKNPEHYCHKGAQ